MSSVNITPEAIDAIKRFKVPKEDIGFGRVTCPVMIQSDYKDEKWSPFELIPFGPITLSPTCKVLHYAQEIFEGMKAYKVDGVGPILFRPEENVKRFNLSADRMVMPRIDEKDFMDGVITLVKSCSDFIPSNSGESLYLRPFMFATEEHLGIKPADQFKFLILASPSAAFFSSDSVEIQIERRFARACPDGIGHAKTGGNYAASLLAVKEARQRGYDQTLWLDAYEKKYVEELSGMNFFCVVEGEIYTPEMTKSILDGITRRSLIDLARHKGYKVHETKIDINWLIEKIQSQQCSEAFACGTAAIITPIKLLGETDRSQGIYPLKESYGAIAKELRQDLLDLQEGRGEDPFNWTINLKTL